MAGGVKLTSAVFNKPRSKAIVSRGLTRIAKRFKKITVDNMTQSNAAGRTYKRGAGPGFSRFHQASARGQRPEPDTFNLVNSVRDSKKTELKHDVFVDDGKAPYGKYLQNPSGLNRPIATKEDADRYAADEMQEEVQRIRRELVK